MRIVSYNILDGGGERESKIADIIIQQKPDIVALVEADEKRIVEHIAGEVGMNFIHAGGGKKGAALLSRWTIRKTIDHAALRSEKLKSLLEASVVEPNGQE